MSVNSTDSSIVCEFHAGKPLGITFEWDNGLKVSEINGTIYSFRDEEENKTPRSDDDVENKKQLLPGDVLTIVNEQEVAGLTFDEIVTLLRAAEAEDRYLTFQQPKRSPSSAPDPVYDDPPSLASEDDFSEFSDANSLLYGSPVHAKIHRTLTQSVKLDAIHVNVVNLSYWYKQRKLLGGRKSMAVVITQNKQTMRYESNMFVVKPSDDDGELRAQKKFLSTHNSKWNAYRHCEAMMKERDMNPALNKKLPANSITPENILSSHFRVVVVSEVFYRMSYRDRVTLVYQELLRGMGSQPKPNTHVQELTPGSGHCAPNRMKMASFFGKNVCNLPLFRFIVSENKSVPLNFLIEPLTPSQWKPHVYPAPLSERFGPAHLDFQSVQVEKAAKGAAHKGRVRTLTNTETVDRFGNTQPMSRSSTGNPNKTGTDDADMKMMSAELLGLDSEVLASEFRKRTGGVYSHFFKDLTPGIGMNGMKGLITILRNVLLA
jgi:acid stress-induced BolA-like protein IbaG/YrbA